MRECSGFPLRTHSYCLTACSSLRPLRCCPGRAAMTAARWPACLPPLCLRDLRQVRSGGHASLRRPCVSFCWCTHTHAHAHAHFLSLSLSLSLYLYPQLARRPWCDRAGGAGPVGACRGLRWCPRRAWSASVRSVDLAFPLRGHAVPRASFPSPLALTFTLTLTLRWG
jgi:hypothetical protein